MSVSVDVELPRAGLGSDLAASLAAHGLRAEVVETDDTCTLHVTYERDEHERLLDDVAHGVEGWIGEKLLPLVVERADGVVVVRPPSG
jgi:hypothetical protein